MKKEYGGNRKDELYVNGKWLSYIEFGRIVESKRKERKMTQKDLGELLAKAEDQTMSEGSCRNTISRIEQGIGKTSPSRVKYLCDILDISNTELGDDNEQLFLQVAMKMLKDYAEECHMPIGNFKYTDGTDEFKNGLDKYYDIFKKVLAGKYMRELLGVSGVDTAVIKIYKNVNEDIEDIPVSPMTFCMEATAEESDDVSGDKSVTIDMVTAKQLIANYVPKHDDTINGSPRLY